ncbi:unnamed protein product [Phytophthora lilii]|uniref:Unnamed protein product n=1 Tax=Phytophthora lilii TaxID=2077276 RepID=A0A9W6WFZ3_9STRA|nr:unnamed protein product [Phytophthora lilii]
MRSSGGDKEEGPAMDLKEKPHPPPQGPSGPPAFRDVSRGLPDEGPSVRTEGSSPKTTPSIPRLSSTKPTTKPTKMKLKAPNAG